MNIDELAEMKIRDKSKYWEWIDEAKITELSEIVSEDEAENMADLSRKELLELAVDWMANGTRGFNEMTRKEILEELKERVDQRVEDIKADMPDPPEGVSGS